MRKHKTKEWHYTEIATEMGFLTVDRAKDINDFLKQITADPKNDTGINRGKDDAYYHLTKITKPKKCKRKGGKNAKKTQ